MLSLKNVTFQYKNSKAMEDITIEIKKQEFVAIIGVNGSGKSTLAKLAAGIVLPKSGDVLVEDINTKDKKHWLDIRKKVGIVFQNPENQLVFNTIEADIQFMLENFGVDTEEIDRRITEVLPMVGMQEYRTKDIQELSMGQKQRLAIAEMLALKPEYLILDEPTAMLDPVAKKEFIKTIIELKEKEKLSVLYTTNVVEEIISADRIIALHKGKVILECTPQTIVEYTAQFKQIGLDIPQTIELIAQLRQKGMVIDSNKLDISSIVEEIVRGKSC